MAETGNEKHSRVAGLDLIRALAILMVVMAHSYCLLQRMTGSPMVIKMVNYLERYIINLGPVGVELFFVLSGFLIGGILIRTFERTDFTFADVRRFWVRRWLRTLPNYWLILTLNILLLVFVKGQPVEPSQFLGYFFLQNFIHPDLLHVFPEGWSLSIEEWFYFSLPIVLFVAAAIAKPKQKKRFLLRVFVGYLLTFLAIRFVNAFHPLNGVDPDEGIRKIVVFRLDAVMYGVLAAYFVYFRQEAAGRLRKRLFVFSLFGSVVFYFFIVRYELAFRSQHNGTFRFLSNAFLYFVIPALFALSLPYAAGVQNFKARWLVVPVRHISKISYSIYLVHFSLFVAWFLSIPVTSTAQGLALYVAYWLVVITVSSLLFRFFERPVMQLREKIRKR